MDLNILQSFTKLISQLNKIKKIVLNSPYAVSSNRLKDQEEEFKSLIDWNQLEGLENEYV